MKLLKTKRGNFILKVEGSCESLYENGKATHFIQLPHLSEMLRDLNSPLLEDLYALIGQELLERDKEWVRKNF